MAGDSPCAARTCVGGRLAVAPRFAIVPARAVWDSQLSKATFRVLAAICLHADRNGGGVFAAPKTLMRESTVGRTAFFSALQQLIDFGYVEREAGRPKDRNGRYRVIQDAQRVPENELVSAAKRTDECRKTSLASLNTPLNTHLPSG